MTIGGVEASAYDELSRLVASIPDDLKKKRKDETSASGDQVLVLPEDAISQDTLQTKSVTASTVEESEKLVVEPSA